MWREGLFYKMIIAGIPNKIFQIIYSMYQEQDVESSLPMELEMSSSQLVV